MNCSSTCATPGRHLTFGECLRAKRIQIKDLAQLDATRKWDSDLAAYADAKRLGIQPSGIDRASVDRAMRISEADGTAFQG